MNINPTKKTDKLIGEIFNQLLDLRTSNRKSIDSGFDSAAATYFTAPVNGEATYYYACSFKTADELKTHFREILKNKLENIPDSITAKLSELAFLLKENNTEQDADLSALIYTLY